MEAICKEPCYHIVGSYAEPYINTQTLYLEITFLWANVDEIPAECHHAILKHYLFALLSSVTCRTAAEEIDGNLNNVQWECHLSRASANKTIHDQLLTFHHLFTKAQNRLWEDKAQAIERLPVLLLGAALAWFRVSFHNRLPADQSYTFCRNTMIRTKHLRHGVIKSSS